MTTTPTYLALLVLADGVAQVLRVRAACMIDALHAFSHHSCYLTARRVEVVELAPDSHEEAP